MQGSKRRVVGAVPPRSHRTIRRAMGWTRRTRKRFGAVVSCPLVPGQPGRSSIRSSYASRESRTKSILSRVSRGCIARGWITLAGSSVICNRFFRRDCSAVGAVLDRFFQHRVSTLGWRFTWPAQCIRNSLSWDPQPTGSALGRCRRWQSKRVFVQQSSASLLGHSSRCRYLVGTRLDRLRTDFCL